jgi:origin recognition complex subunit 1
MPHKTTGMTSRKQQNAKAERARRILAGSTLRREDSDDELGEDDLPWEWVFSGPGDISDEGDDKDVKDPTINKRKGRPMRKASKARERKIIGAKMGTFECKIGDCVLLKADSNEAWAGIICDFLEEDDEMGATVMCENRFPLILLKEYLIWIQGLIQRRKFPISKRRDQTSCRYLLQ